MKASIKRNFLSICVTLKKGELSLKDMASGKKVDKPALQQLLGDMQECAIQLGRSIEKTEGEGTASVARLEEYCELLWQLYIAEKRPERRELLDALKKKLDEISETIRTEFEEETTVLFLPSAAGRWGEMERLWKEFSDKEHCTVYVAPVPYQRDDGEGFQTVYEGEDFPDEVPAYYYEDLELDEEHPDIIFWQDPAGADREHIRAIEQFSPGQLEQYTEYLLSVSVSETGEEKVDVLKKGVW